MDAAPLDALMRTIMIAQKLVVMESAVLERPALTAWQTVPAHRVNCVARAYARPPPVRQMQIVMTTMHPRQMYATTPALAVHRAPMCRLKLRPNAQPVHHTRPGQIV